MKSPESVYSRKPKINATTVQIPKNTQKAVKNDSGMLPPYPLLSIIVVFSAVVDAIKAAVPLISTPPQVT